MVINHRIHLIKVLVKQIHLLSEKHHQEQYKMNLIENINILLISPVQQSHIQLR
jgi:hypothetical protein